MPGLTVTAGQTFLLVVDNFTRNTQGYTITFTGTAQYFDNTPPKMDSTGQLCASSYDNQIDYLRQVFVRFNELISPTTIAADGSDFVVQDVASGTLVPITAAAPINPPQTSQVRLTVGSTLVPGQTYKIRIGYNPPGSGSSNGQPGTDGNTISDQCGITIPITNIPQGSSADSIVLVVRDTLTPTISVTPPTCVGAATGQISVSTTGGVSPYQYALVSGTPNTPPNTGWNASGTFTNRAAGTYTLWIRDAARCIIRRVIQLTDPPPLSIVVTDVTPVTCRGGQDGQIQVTVTGGTSPYTYTWQTAGGDSLPSMGSTVSGLTAGTYTLTVTDAKGCLLGPITFTVPYSYFVEIDSIAYTLVQDCPDKSYLFSAYVRGDGPFTYRWTWEDGSTEVGSATMSHSYSPLLQGDVTIRLQVEGAGPCYAEASLTFLSKACSGLFIPTAFTPNGDGINDIWTIQAIGFSRYTLVVFDRWGKEVFNNGGDMTKQWNGTINGQPAPEGV
jgi:gliding motility-associated-like protein